ncbi:hypothetical protein thalar_03370 [Litoreibacter arenae DSM 19593]|uniref:Uncharacterized protein n=1 Tax=Litoreibacter arenae DSM 19593 TaxID=1123360 RepID=S9RHT9_9RHOB|nr:hypothetical protein thalar_03370 [Litoreibacter arenae DSM 19593]
MGPCVPAIRGIGPVEAHPQAAAPLGLGSQRQARRRQNARSNARLEQAAS